MQDEVFVNLPPSQIPTDQTQQMVPMQQQPVAPVMGNSNGYAKKKGGNNGRPNFFRRQEKKFGENWIKTVKLGERDIVNIVIDMIKGNLEPNDVLYFYDQNINNAMRYVVFDKLCLAEFRAITNNAYLDLTAKSNLNVQERFNQFIQCDNIVLSIWRSMNQYMVTLANLSNIPNGQQQLIDFTINQFMPVMRQFSRNVNLL